MRCLSLFRCAVVAALTGLGAGQTFTNCDPTQRECDPNSALGSTIDLDLTTRNNTGPFDLLGRKKIESNSDEGALFVIESASHAPTIVLPEYIFFGRLEVILRASNGTGVVTAIVLQSDTLDELNMEWLGGDNAQVQTSYFRKGNTTTYDRGAYHPNLNPVGAFHNYTIDWDRERIQWLIDGTLARELTSADTKPNDTYPQTPMSVRIGTWVAGLEDAPSGTIEWAGGITDFEEGPFTAAIKRIKVVDYANGVENATEYVYTDTKGDWESIEVKTGEKKPDLIDGDESSKDSEGGAGDDDGGTNNPGSGNDGGNSTDDSPNSSGGLGPGAIAGIAVGAVAGCVIIGGVCFFLGRRNKRKKKAGQNVAAHDMSLMGGKGELDGRPREKPDANEAPQVVPLEPPQELDGQWTMRPQQSELGGRELAAELQDHDMRRL